MHLVPLHEFNPCHDPGDGKFTFRNQGDCEGGEGPRVERGREESLAHVIRQQADTPEEHQYAKEIAQAELANRKLLAQWGPEGTRSKYFDKKTGAYTPERQKLHDKIVQKVLTHEVTKDGWKPREQPLESQQHPVAILFVGMSASGKTTAAGKLNYKDKLAINTDDVKSLFPEWTGSNASVLHDESQDVADRITEIGRANRYNLVLDSTMRSLGGVDYEGGRAGITPTSRIQALKRSGYRVEARFTDVDVETSVRRALTRYVKQKQATGKGRYVPIGYIKANYDARYGTRPRRSFEQVKHLFDAYVIADNRGTKPRIVGKKGKLTEVGRAPHETLLTELDWVYWRSDGISLREVEAAERYAESFIQRFQRRGSCGSR